jgi:hypothetical protein
MLHLTRRVNGNQPVVPTTGSDPKNIRHPGGVPNTEVFRGIPAAPSGAVLPNPMIRWCSLRSTTG